MQFLSMLDRKFVIANLKNVHTVSETLAWINEVGLFLSDFFHYTVVVCPSFVALDPSFRLICDKGYPLFLGAQCVSRFGLGAYTGEVGAFVLRDYVRYALLGHSERRHFFHESDEDICEMVVRCKEVGIEPIVLVRDEHDVIPFGVRFFAWEPVSAIGTGNAVDSDSAAFTIAALSHGGQLLGIYGGSVNALNIASFLHNDAIAGVLIGSASYKVNDFLELLHALR